MFLKEPLIKLCYSGSNLVGMGLTLTALGENAVKREMFCTAAALHILVAGNLATSSMLSLSISSRVVLFFFHKHKCPSFPQVLMNVINCFSVLKLASGKCLLVNMMCCCLLSCSFLNMMCISVFSTNVSLTHV